VLARRLRLMGPLLVLALVATGCPADEGGDGGDGGGGNLLQTITDRGQVRCGVNDEVPGFGFVDEAGNYSGFDIEFCRAVAAAVTGDAGNVEFRSLTSEQRFTALQGQQVDVLIRNTTWTATRDGTEGAAFAATTFYDGQGMMVRADSPFQSLEDMRGTNICVLSGTTTELNLETQFQARGIEYEPISLETNEAIQPAFIQRRCEGWTSDRSQLAGIRSAWPETEGGPGALRILDLTMSKEPLGPVVRDGDARWYDAVNWTVIATILAEEHGITQANVDQMRQSQDPDVQRLLGTFRTEEGSTFNPGLGLPDDFAYQVIKQVGNYGEIYERTVGPNTPLGLERGPNDLWTRGGLLYGPPYR